MVMFAATLAITLYVVTDIEFPRLGFIRVESFDHFLDDVYEQMTREPILKAAVRSPWADVALEKPTWDFPARQL